MPATMSATCVVNTAARAYTPKRDPPSRETRSRTVEPRSTTTCPGNSGVMVSEKTGETHADTATAKKATCLRRNSKRHVRESQKDRGRQSASTNGSTAPNPTACGRHPTTVRAAPICLSSNNCRSRPNDRPPLAISEPSKLSKCRRSPTNGATRHAIRPNSRANPTILNAPKMIQARSRVANHSNRRGTRNRAPSTNSAKDNVRIGRAPLPQSTIYRLASRFFGL